MDKTLNWRRSGNRLTDTPTNTHRHTGPITIHCAAKPSVQCNQTSTVPIAQVQFPQPSAQTVLLCHWTWFSCSAVYSTTEDNRGVPRDVNSITCSSIHPTHPTKTKIFDPTDPTEPTPWIDPTIPQPRRFPYLTLMWSETVGLRTRPVWDQINRSWS